MERRKAIATAAAITMSAVSAIFAFGVSSAALGTQSSQSIQSTPAPQALSQPAVAPTGSPVQLQAHAQATTHEKESEGPTSQSAPQPNATTNATRGESND